MLRAHKTSIKIRPLRPCHIDPVCRRAVANFLINKTDSVVGAAFFPCATVFWRDELFFAAAENDEDAATAAEGTFDDIASGALAVELSFSIFTPSLPARSASTCKIFNPKPRFVYARSPKNNAKSVQP